MSKDQAPSKRQYFFQYCCRICNSAWKKVEVSEEAHEGKVNDPDYFSDIGGTLFAGNETTTEWFRYCGCEDTSDDEGDDDE